MPMEDTDIPCPFCGNMLTDMDGMMECQSRNGCGASTDWTIESDNIAWYYKDLYLTVYSLEEWVYKEIKKWSEPNG